MLVAEVSQLVLRVAGNSPFLGRNLRMPAHRQASARLCILRNQGCQVTGTQAQQLLQALAGGLGTVDLKQYFTKTFVNGYRRVRGCVAAAGNATLNLAQRNFVRYHIDRGKPRAASLLNVHARRCRVQTGTQYGLANQVKVAGVFHNGTTGHFAYPLAGKPIALHQPFNRGGEHVLIAGAKQSRIRTSERDAIAANNGNPANCCAHTMISKP